MASTIDPMTGPAGGETWMGEVALDVDSVTRSYPGFDLGPISFQLRAGRIYGLLGPNGAGKSTLMNSVCGQLDHGGTVRAGGTLIDSRSWRLRERVAYVPETPYLYDDLTVAQTLRIASLLFSPWDRDTAGVMQDKLGLEPKRRVVELSKGMRTKLAILVGISHRARLLVLDEPTSGLDPESRAELHQFLRTLPREHGASVLISSHQFEDMEHCADEIIVLRGGQIKAMLPIGDLPAALPDFYFSTADFAPHGRGE